MCSKIVGWHDLITSVALLASRYDMSSGAQNTMMSENIGYMAGHLCNLLITTVIGIIITQVACHYILVPSGHHQRPFHQTLISFLKYIASKSAASCKKTPYVANFLHISTKSILVSPCSPSNDLNLISLLPLSSKFAYLAMLFIHLLACTVSSVDQQNNK